MFSLYFCFNSKIKGDEIFYEKYFTSKEDSLVNEVVDIFDLYLKNKENNNDVNVAYNCFLRNLNNLKDPDDFYKQIYQLDSIFDIILDKLKESVLFKDIWIEVNSVNKYGDKLILIDYNLKGKYWLYAKNKFNKQNCFNEYFNYIEEAGGLVPNIIYGFPRIYQCADFSNRFIRFFTIVHFITMSRCNSRL
jgi:hypothetical protein